MLRSCMDDGDDKTPRLKPHPIIPALGTLAGAVAGFAFYWFVGCDSG